MNASQYVSRRAVSAYRAYVRSHRDAIDPGHAKGIAFGRLLELWRLADTLELKRERELIDRLIRRTYRTGPSAVVAEAIVTEQAA